MRLLAVVTVTLLAAFASGCSPAATNTPAPTPEPQITPQPEILSHVLKVIADPEGAAKFVFNPLPIGQGLFVHGRTVTIDVLLQPGWQIDKWVGPVFEVVGESAKITMNSSQQPRRRRYQRPRQGPLPLYRPWCSPVDLFIGTFKHPKVTKSFPTLESGRPLIMR